MLEQDPGVQQSGVRGRPLLQPADLGDFQLPNRVVMAPLTRARAANDELAPTELHAVYYGQRATAGLIVTEGTWVSERAIGFINVPGIYREEQVAGWRRVTDVVHVLGGRIVLQLWHSGAVSHPEHRSGELPAGPSPVNPQEMSFTWGGRKPTLTPREMTPADIRTVLADFRAAAANARRAGFDGVEIGAVGSPSLPAQFLNPRLNQRTDAYGGDRARRRRLLLEIIDAVAGPWQGRCVGVRLSPHWTAPRFTPDDELLTDYDELVAELASHPVAYLHLRGPDRTTPDRATLDRASPDRAAPDLDAIARYRHQFDGPLIANNGFGLESGNAAIEAGLADAVSFGTPFIANPDLVTRFALNRELATGDPDTFYTGAAEGYIDYPAS